MLASFALFAIDQASGASKHQVAALGGPVSDQTASQRPGQPRRFIDGAASVLTSPFRSVIHSGSSEWGAEIEYTLLAVIVYGFGIGFLARWART